MPREIDSNWFNDRYRGASPHGEVWQDSFDYVLGPDLYELLHVAQERLGEAKPLSVSLSDSRLEALENRLKENIRHLREKSELDPALNFLVVFDLFRYVANTGDIPDDYVNDYKKALERHRIDPARGFVI